MTTVQRFDDPTASWVDITDYGAFQIDNGVSDVLLAPEATFEFPRTATVAAGTRLRVQESGTTIFEGNVTKTQPQAGAGGRAMRVDAAHDAYGLFEETVSLSVTGTDEDVLNAALSAAAGTWTLAYDGTGTSLADTYDVERRSIKRVFRDMVDRVGRVWWVDVDHTIHVATLGAGGQLAAVDTSTDGAAVTQYVPDDVETVVNDVTVTGTGGEAVTGTATDSASINEYGRQPESVNVSYITTSTEASDYASALLNPEPDAQATVRVAASAANVAPPVVNQTLDVTDTQGTGLNDTLPIESQTITQGSAELGLGEGEGVNLAQFNRSEKSKGDRTEPGSVYGNDRIADDSIDTAQLRDTAVDQFKLKDGAVQSIKLADGSVLTTKLDNLAVTETKIDDNSISTPKLQAGSVDADKIETGTITGTEFDRVVNGEVVDTQNIISLLADKVIFGTTGDNVDGLTTPENGTTVISGGKIETNSLTADVIDTLDLDTTQLTISDDPDNPTTGFKFSVDSQGNVDLSPLAGTRADIGLTRRLSFIFALNGEFENGLTVGQPGQASPAGGTAVFNPDNVPRIFIGSDDSDSSPVIEPAVDQNGLLGTPGNAWGTVRSSRFIDDDTGNTIGSGSQNVDGEYIEPNQIATNTDGTGTRTSPLHDGGANFYFDGGASPGDHIQIAETVDSNSNDDIGVIPRPEDATDPEIGVLGDAAYPWKEVNAKNYITRTPDAVPSEQVDLDELCECDWYHPPQYVREEQAPRVGTPTKSDTPGEESQPATPPEEDGPNPGVEIGTMSNYLLEISKAQQEHIADLTARVDDLEARLEALEADGTNGGPNA